LIIFINTQRFILPEFDYSLVDYLFVQFMIFALLISICPLTSVIHMEFMKLYKFMALYYVLPFMAIFSFMSLVSQLTY